MDARVVTPQGAFCKQRPDKPTARRAFWQAEKQRCGTDWRGVIDTMRAVLGERSSTFLEACASADAAAGPRPDPAPIRLVADSGVPTAGELQAEYERAIRRRRDQHGAARSTLMAGEFLARTDPRRLETWLMAHSPTERAGIVAHLRQRRDWS